MHSRKKESKRKNQNQKLTTLKTSILLKREFLTFQVSLKFPRDRMGDFKPFTPRTITIDKVSAKHFRIASQLHYYRKIARDRLSFSFSNLEHSH